jgi:hypothetical protein
MTWFMSVPGSVKAVPTRGTPAPPPPVPQVVAPKPSPASPEFRWVPVSASETKVVRVQGLSAQHPVELYRRAFHDVLHSADGFDASWLGSALSFHFSSSLFAVCSTIPPLFAGLLLDHLCGNLCSGLQSMDMSYRGLPARISTLSPSFCSFLPHSCRLFFSLSPSLGIAMGLSSHSAHYLQQSLLI